MMGFRPVRSGFLLLVVVALLVVGIVAVLVTIPIGPLAPEPTPTPTPDATVPIGQALVWFNDHGTACSGPTPIQWGGSRWVCQQDMPSSPDFVGVDEPGPTYTTVLRADGRGNIVFVDMRVDQTMRAHPDVSQAVGYFDAALTELPLGGAVDTNEAFTWVNDHRATGGQTTVGDLTVSIASWSSITEMTVVANGAGE